MSALVLKLIAFAAMFTDHFFAACINPNAGRLDIWGIGSLIVPGTGTRLYWIGRMIGRMAFPIFCFQIAEGVKYTRDWKKYLLRLCILAAVSEVFFDYALKGSLVDTEYQNVFFTLIFGMLIAAFMKNVNSKWKYAAWPFLVAGLGFIAENVLKTDYGWSGVAAIAVMALMNEPWEKLFGGYDPVTEQLIHVVFAALGICVLYFDNHFEMYAFAALIPIALYNGTRGYSGKKLQKAFYLFYPVHLAAISLILLCFK